MNLIDTVFSIQGSGSSVGVDGLVIENNDLSDLDSHFWSGIEVRDAAEASFTNVRFCNNAVVENLAAAFEGSTLSMEAVEVCEVTGGSNTVSGPKGFHLSAILTQMHRMELKRVFSFLTWVGV